jgi:hypothetical protein
MKIRLYEGDQIESEQFRAVPVSGKYRGEKVETTVPVAVCDEGVYSFWPPGWCLSHHVTNFCLKALQRAISEKREFFDVVGNISPAELPAARRGVHRRFFDPFELRREL